MHLFGRIRYMLYRTDNVLLVNAIMHRILKGQLHHEENIGPNRFLEHCSCLFIDLKVAAIMPSMNQASSDKLLIDQNGHQPHFLCVRIYINSNILLV